MKTKAICSFFVLFAIAAVMVSSTPAAFADHPKVTITPVEGSAFSMDCRDVGDGCYSPMVATVGVGGEVTFSNTDASFHSFTAGTVDGFIQNPTGEFDVITMETGDEGTWMPETAGTVPYYCSYHVWMTGTIIVEEEAAEEEAIEDVELMVTITDSQVLDGTQVDLEFSELHVNYEIIAMQDGEEIFKEAAHSMELTASHQIDAVGSDENPIDVEIVSLGIGPPGANQDWTGPTGSVATTQVVPEFGTIAMMILAVAIISIVAVTAKSRVVPRF